MQVVSVDIMHLPMDLENTSPLDLETDHPPLDNETDPPSLYLETDPPSLDNETDLPSLDNETDPTFLDLETDPPPLDHPCPEANHSPVLSDLHADQPHCQDFQTSHPPSRTSHPPARTSHPPARTSHPPTRTSHPPAQGFLANHPSIGLRFTEDVKTESSSDITTKVGSL